MKMKMKKNGKLNIATVSDVHFFHPRVLTIHIIDSFARMFPDNDVTGELDMIIVAGDLFDRIRTLENDEVYDVFNFFAGFLEMCKRRNIKLRILEGTPSHDRTQSRFVRAINRSLGENKADVRYFDSLCIDYEEEYGINILYIPDEWHHDHDVIWDQVQEQLRLKQIDHVEIGVMHGMFEHQIPPGVPVQAHKADRYMSVVSWFVTIGHVHTMSILDRIYAQGSLERLSQNEEGAKGIFKFSVDMDTGNFKAEFIVNEEATPFITIDLRKETFESSRDIVKERIEGMTRGFVRLELSSELFGEGILDHLMSLGSEEIKWSKKVEKKAKEDPNEKVFGGISELPLLNKTTMSGLIAAEMETKFIDPEVQTLALSIFEEVLNE